MKKIYAVVVFGLMPACLFAQDKIETERPSESQSTETVSKNNFQGEFGFEKSRKTKQIIAYNTLTPYLGLALPKKSN